MSAQLDEPIINHHEAAILAEMKQSENNIARCYLDIRKTLSDLVDVLASPGDGIPPKELTERLKRTLTAPTND